VPQKRKISDPTSPPAGWVTREDLVAATDVSDRNLLNWCAKGLVPRPMRRFLGGRAWDRGILPYRISSDYSATS
jgi:hypothetical protein